MLRNTQRKNNNKLTENLKSNFYAFKFENSFIFNYFILYIAK
jgi:hypothetical protein